LETAANWPTGAVDAEGRGKDVARAKKVIRSTDGIGHRLDVAEAAVARF